MQPDLTHEFRDDAMECGALVAKAFLSGTQSTEVLCQMRHVWRTNINLSLAHLSCYVLFTSEFSSCLTLNSAAQRRGCPV